MSKADSTKRHAAELKAELAALRKEVAQLRQGGDSSGDNGRRRPAKPKEKPSKKTTSPKSSKKQPATSNGRAEPARQPGRGRRVAGQWYRQFGSWGFSVIAHLLIFVVLGLWMLPGLMEPDPPELTALTKRPEEELNQLLDPQTTPTVTTMQNHQGVLTQGHTMSLESAADPATDTVSDSLTNPSVKIGDLAMDRKTGNSLTVPLSAEAPGDPHAVVDGYDEAMDRITREILLMLDKSKVLVVWCFDQSGSMKDDQEEIATRISRVYKELGLKGATQGDALQTGIVSYGAKTKLHTRVPTSNVEAIEQAIREVPIDKSGAEMMCDAVGQTIAFFTQAAKAGGRQMALILVTDESGDKENSVEKLELAIATAKAARCRIYVLGREAVFGYLYAHYLWRHPQTGQLHKIPIDRGPETPYAEALQTSGFRRRYDSHPAGFGPYEQCRMARETGGIFFMLPSIEVDLVHDDANDLRLVEAGLMSREELRKKISGKRRFQIEALRPYMPSLESRPIYARERDNSPLRKDLWTVIWTLNPYNPEAAKVIEMRLRFTGVPAEFAKEVRQEWLDAKTYFKFLKRAEEQMAKLAPLREREIYPRWQANYDLIYAQVLAYKVRLHEYGAYLETFAKAFSRNPDVREEAIAKLGKDPRTFPLRKPHPNKKPNHFLRLAYWEMVHRPETITGDTTRYDIERARRMFEAVIKKHPGTPWADRAQWELKRGFGVELLPRYHHDHPPVKRKPGKPVPRIPVPKL